jgi:hypothetical protein
LVFGFIDLIFGPIGGKLTTKYLSLNLSLVYLSLILVVGGAKIIKLQIAGSSDVYSSTMTLFIWCCSAMQYTTFYSDQALMMDQKLQFVSFEVSMMISGLCLIIVPLITS